MASGGAAGRLARGALGSARACARRHHDPPARPGAARRADADGRAAPARGDPRQGRLRLPRGLGRRRLRHGGPPRRREPVGADPRAERAHRDAARDGAARPLPRRLAPGRRRLRPPLRRLGRRERDRGLPPARPAERRREPARGRRGDHERGQGVRRRARLRLRLHERDRRAGRAGAQAARRSAPRACCCTIRRARSSRTAPQELVETLQGGERPAGRPLLPGCGRQRDGRGPRGRARGRRPDRLRGLSGRADRPPGLGRGARDRARRARARHRRRRRPPSGEASELVDEHIGDEPVTPLAPRIAVRAAEHKVPPGLVAALDTHLRALGPATAPTRCSTSWPKIREEVGWPPLASPIGQILGSQALLHVLSASRYQTVVDELRAPDRGPLRQPARADRRDRQARGHALGRRAGGGGARRPRRRSAPRPKGSPRARRSCCCSRSSARRRSRCCSRSAAAPAATRASAPAASTRRAPSGSARSSASSRSRASAR